MKKYLMTGVAALAICAAFTSCSKSEELYDQSVVDGQKVDAFQDQYAAAFTKFIGGPVGANVDWGFGARSLTRANTGETYPATHEYTDANGNVVAGANMNHNQWGSSDLQSNPFGGWIVPDPLTEGQKLRVQKYFQSHPNLSYEDPHYRHFFVQQVYTGGTDNTVTTGNKEQNVAADGTTKTGASLNQLTVGVANSHINDFNSGTCSTSSVLNHEGKTQSDQITLMVNVYDTSCFGYHETSGSDVPVEIQHNDKMALVSAADIDTWGEANNIGEKVDDEWHRSFMGFDYEMLPQSAIITDNYAMLSQVQNINNCQYAVYNNQVMKIGQKPAGESKADKDITDNLIATSGEAKIEKVDGNLIWNGKYITVNVNADATGYTKLVIEYKEATPNSYNLSIGVDGGYINGYDQNRKSGETKVECDLVNVSKITNLTFMNGNADFKIKSVYLTTGANEVYYDSQYLLAGTEQIPFYSTNTNMYGGDKITLTSGDFYTTVDGKNCLNLDRIKELYDDGYRPIDTALWNWVKYVPVCDGYYSDWIVTLTEAKRQDTTPTYRVIAEDLSAEGDTDFDFNDVVFDVEPNEDGTAAKLVLQACGGIYRLEVNGVEVHGLYGYSADEKGLYPMINTGDGPSGLGSRTITESYAGNFKTDADIRATIQLITVKVWKPINKDSKDVVECTLSANRGEPASKVLVDKSFGIVPEHHSIADQNNKFTSYARGEWADNFWWKK